MSSLLPRRHLLEETRLGPPGEVCHPPEPWKGSGWVTPTRHPTCMCVSLEGKRHGQAWALMANL